ncbi:DUF6298 domain-containing protein [Flavilitoribacter nigricans]|uniref:Pectate lyase n=1 Tax=Flavilitoribacter nigricans (strain ATCC 23147 / DSM 23189 / NBRC 102662 / NCIMB 1420 / SS-2) TaxID=1122177 RepID=A0A2D0N1Y8_FLAN2|nr:DUF6298 domain-containing protein [Flavilitoribacter nigricans]PHN02440.1 pectate lyase [Flavilitoribacter nigricans DSM 23189 = NBRC 102662]
MQNRTIRHLLRNLLLVSIVLLPFTGKAQSEALPLLRPQNGALLYTADSLGNRIPDYSYCGYRSSEVELPIVPAVLVVQPMQEDATATLQGAIDHLSTLPVQANGFRGAILLEEGRYRLNGRLTIRHSGIVIRGRGAETVLVAGGTDRQTLIRVLGKDDREWSANTPVTEAYVPVGARELQVENPEAFRAGDQVTIRRPSTQTWIDLLGMNEYGGGTGWLKWRPGERDLLWERTVLAVEGSQLQLDAPLTSALDTAYGGGTVAKLQWPGRIEQIGIENLSLQSSYDPENPKDEGHCWNAISFEYARNAWVRNVSFRHFAGSAVALYETTDQVSVQDCVSTDPVSEIGGERRNTFFTMGQRTLFLRCYAALGRHDFAAGFCAPGPNAFVQCTNYLPYDFSGAIDSWASGLLLDNVLIDGQAIRFSNLERTRQGAGWNAANSMIWQSAAAKIECYNPPTANNWAYGVWARFAGDGHWYEANSHIQPQSLFFAQLAERTGRELNSFDDQLLSYRGASTSKPSHEQAAEATEFVAMPAPDLLHLIARHGLPESLDANLSGARIMEPVLPTESGNKTSAAASVSVRNGLLLFQDKILTGRQMGVPWWRGDDRPFNTEKSQPAITRFVPGRTGLGYTDELSAVVDYMVQEKVALVEHNYGLWYDRRRDDHERVRRMDGDSWAPFYEQPFARSGQGEAWDRLSKYDLTRYNRWYWSRLADFARIAEPKGRILMHQNYFQHNILEAGAHWADSPWRPANNINDTGFPEPPAYAGDKRIFFAGQFYDVDHPVRRALHKAYIRHGLDQLKDRSNVLQSISAEFTGPLHFVEFWLDVIAEWRSENNSRNLICLSTTKDVQDAILANPKYAKLVDVIGIQYWAYRADSSLYTPLGGIHLAPRQNARLESPGKRSFASVYRSVSEYRLRYPDKAVIYSENGDPRWGWAILMAGGSLPPVPEELPEAFYALAASMHPVKGSGPATGYLLENDRDEMIIYLVAGSSVRRNLPAGNYQVDHFTPRGKAVKREKWTSRKGPFTFKNDSEADLILCLHKDNWK